MKKLINKMDGVYIVAKSRLKNVMQKRERGVNSLVIEIGLVIVGVVLLALFNKQVGTFFTEAIASVTAKFKAILGTAV